MRGQASGNITTAAAVSKVREITTAGTGPTRMLSGGAISMAPPNPVMPRMKPASMTAAAASSSVAPMRSMHEMKRRDVGAQRNLLHQRAQRRRGEWIIGVDRAGGFQRLVLGVGIEGGEQQVVIGAERSALPLDPFDAGIEQVARPLHHRLRAFCNAV